MPAKTYVMTVGDALAHARLLADSLQYSIADLTERGDKRLNGMARTKILAETLAKLKTVDFSGAPRDILERQVEFPQFERKDKRGPRRRDLRDNISYILRAVREMVVTIAGADAVTYERRLVLCIGTLESLQFPNQYGKI